MRVRILSHDEWESKGGPEALQIIKGVEPHNVNVVVVEDDDGEILARMGVYAMTYWEGLHVTEKGLKSPAAVRALLGACSALPAERGQNVVFAATQGDKMESLLQKLPGSHEIPAKFWMVRIWED